ncbi:hypothetical protein BDZ89DRAFT_1165012 [Hymenopellis radicata]|nr:hypothetical protein BDZ89DRAFT_1165012 [Hymenopellis radicata]
MLTQYISSTNERSTTRDVSDNNIPDEDAESDYQSCGSSMSDEDEARTAEDYADGELEILEYIGDDKWEPIQACDVPELVGASVTDTDWISSIEAFQLFDALVDVQERSRDAIALLAETIGGPAREPWHHILSHRKKHGVNVTYVPTLQLLLVLIMFGKEAWTNTSWWKARTLYIPSQGMYHQSFTSSLSHEDCPSVLPADECSHRRAVQASECRLLLLPDSASIFGPTNMANLITCLDIAESVAKLVPFLGDVLEGTCGILRKTVQAAENARTARNECRALAEHTASITLAILNEIGPASTISGADINRICELRETIKIVDSRVQSLSKLGRLKYFGSRGRINTEVIELRAQVDNARIAFKIRSDISATRLLTDLKNMQTRLMMRVEDMYEGQKMTHHMLRTLLVEVRGRRTGNVYADDAD